MRTRDTNDPIKSFPRRRRSPPVTREMAARMKTMVASGMLQHDVAAAFGINQGRVSDVVNGKKFPDVPPAPIEGIIP
jgi:hypothetical protein